MFCEKTQNIKSILNQILAGLQMLQPQDIRLRNALDSANLPGFIQKGRSLILK